MVTARTYTCAARRAIVATGANLLASDRRDRVKRAIRNWTFMHESTKIAEAFPCQLWPDLGSIRPTVSLDTSSSFELPAGERAVLSALVRLKSPRVIFEFGTFTGTTTALMADAADPDTEIHTIDLPDSAFPPEGFNGWFTGDMVGRALVDSERPSSDKVVVHREDLSRFNFSAFEGRVDLVLVDADHSYEAVLRDSFVAFRILRPGGTIIWDDYHPTHWGVIRALNELAADHPLERIAGTRLVRCESPRAA